MPTVALFCTLMRHILSVFVLFLVAATRLAAQDHQLDSAFVAQVDSIIQMAEQQKVQREVEKVVRQTERKMLEKEMSFGVGGLMVLGRGALLSWTDHNFITEPAQFEAKSDRCNWTDYGVASAPLVANWVMKLAGVKSRSKTERMITANAMALGISVGVSQLLKHTVTETRPDQSDQHAFPSGHTCLAFVSATILSREYGYISPWVSVGSYATATATQMLRIHHNKHWVNDLYLGAGIGTVSTSLGYFLTDRIFGEKSINKPEVRRKDVLRLMKFAGQPSGVTLVAGMEVGNRKIYFDDGAKLKTGAAMSAGAELTWHASPYFGLDLMTRMVDAQVKVFNAPQASRLYNGGHLRLYHLDAAARLSAPLGLGHRMGTRVFAGTRIMDGCTITNGVTSYSIPNETKLEIGCGINYECIDTDNYAWGFTADYYHTFSHYLANRYSISSTWKILF